MKMKSTPPARPRPLRRRTGILLGLSLAIAIGLPTPVAASDDDIDLEDIVRRPEIGNYKGYAEFKMAHYQSARRIWEALDAVRFGEASFNLGILYEDGLGVARDMATALDYYRRGAANGSVKAAFRLGLLYWLGAPEVARNEVEGRRYLAIAAAAGDSEAARYLAAGDGDPDRQSVLMQADTALAAGRPAEAVGILQAAAAAGDPHAQTRLAWHYEAGRGIARDLAQAAKWFTVAAEAGNAEAMYALAVMHATGAGRPQDPRRSREWLEKSAALGYPQAVRELQAR